jgi:hypothetical protein
MHGRATSHSSTCARWLSTHNRLAPRGTRLTRTESIGRGRRPPVGARQGKDAAGASICRHTHRWRPGCSIPDGCLRLDQRTPSVRRPPALTSRIGTHRRAGTSESRASHRVRLGRDWQLPWVPGFIQAPGRTANSPGSGRSRTKDGEPLDPATALLAPGRIVTGCRFATPLAMGHVLLLASLERLRNGIVIGGGRRRVRPLTNRTIVTSGLGTAERRARAWTSPAPSAGASYVTP